MLVFPTKAHREVSSREPSIGHQCIIQVIDFERWVADNMQPNLRIPDLGRLFWTIPLSLDCLSR